MSKTVKFALAAAISGFVVTGAAAQEDLFGTQSAADEIGDLQEAIEDDADRQTFTFGNEGRTIGTYGSVALRAVHSTSDTSDTTTTVGIGAQYGFYDGTNGSELNLSYAYSSTGDVVDRDTLNAGYDYTRDFNDAFFGYGNLNVKWDRLADEAGENYRDAFVGVGIGYRILNSDDTQLAVKAGPGYRFIEDGLGTQIDEAAYSVEANFFQRFNDTVYLSDDVQLIGSASDVTVVNELALNVSLSDTLSMRTSYTSKFGGADFNALSNNENTLGASIVYNFN
ncbi:DUF481 domain-containing protein [Loktanella sp. IMCC34160]|uniref:DUF481 domain-containing protein n=1 Tax=Loktanella sp. IMCC34160 TaxID=2510646 RepID=UPI00101DD221|nr:DUF481 domain-containing protein [Loktanella sp. IMCC34160]RYG90668.1 DUF481 domain-containing protein [Loktanella sp. IMCC34160]